MQAMSKSCGTWLAAGRHANHAGSISSVQEPDSRSFVRRAPIVPSQVSTEVGEATPCCARLGSTASPRAVRSAFRSVQRAPTAQSARLYRLRAPPRGEKYAHAAQLLHSIPLSHPRTAQQASTSDMAAAMSVKLASYARAGPLKDSRCTWPASAARSARSATIALEAPRREHRAP
jgi:hypothetical protein